MELSCPECKIGYLSIETQSKHSRWAHGECTCNAHEFIMLQTKTRSRWRTTEPPSEAKANSLITTAGKQDTSPDGKNE